MKLFLASRSPRRIEMLTSLGTELTVVPSDIDEDAFDAATPAELVRLLAREKARAAHLPEGADLPVVAADTVVDLDGVVLGKPKDREDAARMLRALSGRGHQVHTGVAVAYRGKILAEVESSTVFFRELGEEEIARYLSTSEAYDKAGSYGIQGIASLFVTGIEGDYHSVVGLPLCRLNRMLTDLATPGLLPLPSDSQFTR